MFLSLKASKQRIQEAENARRNRQVIVQALSHGQASRHDLFKWSLFTMVGGLALKHDLSPFANSAFASVPTETPLSPLFGALPFTQAMLRADSLTRTPNPMAALSPVQMAHANETQQNLNPALVAAYPAGTWGPLKAAPPGHVDSGTASSKHAYPGLEPDVDCPWHGAAQAAAQPQLCTGRSSAAHQ